MSAVILIIALLAIGGAAVVASSGNSNANTKKVDPFEPPEPNKDNGNGNGGKANNKTGNGGNNAGLQNGAAGGNTLADNNEANNNGTTSSEDAEVVEDTSSPVLDDGVVKCKSEAAIYKIESGKKRHYPSYTVYASWGKPATRDVPCEHLKAMPNGEPMPLKPSTTPLAPDLLSRFKLTTNAAIAGHNDKHVAGTLTQCLQRCVDDPKCKAVDWYKGKNECDFSYAPVSTTGLKTTYAGNPYDNYSLQERDFDLSEWGR